MIDCPECGEPVPEDEIECPCCGKEIYASDEDDEDEGHDEEFPPPSDPMGGVMRRIGGLTEEESDAFGVPFPDVDFD